jgi:hypothetical protein
LEADSREKERQKAREQQESNNRQHAEVKRPEAEQFQKQTQRRPEFGDPKREQEEGFKAKNEKMSSRAPKQNYSVGPQRPKKADTRLRTKTTRELAR